MAAWPTPAIALDIYQHGPVSASIQVFGNLQGWKSGVYTCPSGKPEGGHAIKLLGWGTEGGVGESNLL